MENANQPSDWLTTFPPNLQHNQNESLEAFHSLLSPKPSPELQTIDHLTDNPQTRALHESTCVEPITLIDAFEEDARSSWGEDTRTAEVKGAPVDETSQNSLVCQKDVKSLNNCDHTCSEDNVSKSTYFSVELFEYMWPQESGELFILQDQIHGFFKDKCFDEKYPDLERRNVEKEEKQFLIDKGIIPEGQDDLGLIALRLADVLEVISKDYPDFHKEFVRTERKEEHKNAIDKQREAPANTSDNKNKMIDLVMKAVQSAADYNAHLNQERREERKSCMDLQTFTLHYPIKKNKVKQSIKPGKYPVALLPGQHQDYYQEYSPEELKYLPVNTVLFGPVKELTSIKAMSEGSESDSEDSTVSDESGSSSHVTNDESSSSSEKYVGNKTPPNLSLHLKVKSNAVCKVCKLASETKLKDGKCEELICCSDCEKVAHPSCIEITPEVVSVITTYAWQCMDCKVCSHCRDPNDEDKMLFCDTCDRGYHTFCVGLKNLPVGKWICRQCGSCSVCGALKPGSDASKTQWHYGMPKVDELNLMGFKPKLICSSCFKKKR